MKRWTWSENWARTPRAALASFLICFLSILIAGPCWADDAADKAARELAHKLVPQLDQKLTFHVDVRDLTSELSPAELNEARAALESELHAYGVRIGAGGADSSLRVSLSENPDGRLWVAEFLRDEKSATVMLLFAKATDAASPQGANSVQAQSQLIFEEAEPILDFAILRRHAEDPTEIIIVGSQALALYDQANGHWDMTAKQPIPHTKPTPRDVRGRIVVMNSRISVFAGDASCGGDVGDFKNVRCNSGNGWVNDWPIWKTDKDYVGISTDGRNWFGPSKSDQPMVSVSGLEVGGKPVWIATGTDGNLRISNQIHGEAAVTILGWRNEIATTRSACGTHWQILATGNRDYAEPDTITAFEWRNNAMKAVSGPTEMSGPVVELWSDADGGPARAVVHNLKTGNYEAYLLKVWCSQ